MIYASVCLTTELDVMYPETRPANRDGTMDDLIAHSVVVGTHERVDDNEDD